MSDPASQPTAILPEVLSMLPRGHALDIACGAGRNAVFLAARGWNVTAIDSSGSALTLAQVAAKSQHTPVTLRSGREFSKVKSRSFNGQLDLIEADLEELPLPRERFHLIICINYLQRSIFRAIEDALLPGGVLLYETFTRAQLQFARGPRNPAYLLEAGELRNAFPALTPLFFRELCAGKGIATLLARKPE